MANLEILEVPDSRLRTVAKPVDTFDDELVQLVEDMIETMYAAKGIGLAATQVNVHRRLLVLDVSEEQNTPREYINPEITQSEGTETCEEGCLSVPGIYANVTRAERIHVKALNRNGEPFEEDLDGMHAVCLQHEIDHLDGKVFIDYLSPLKRRMAVKKLEKARKQAEQDAHRARL